MGHYRDMGGKHPTPPDYYQSPHPTHLLAMTKKQIRDLQAFAIELTKEGRKDAAKEVLALISTAN